MAKDYFQDITPPAGDPRPPRLPQKPQPLPPVAPEPDFDVEDDLTTPAEPHEVPIRISDTPAPVRGIRNIPAPRAARPRMDEMREAPQSPGIMGRGPRPPKASSRWWMWGAAAVALIVVIGLGLLAFRKTTVTVTPRSHTAVLNSATQLIAYPAATAASGTLAYTVQVSDLTDSEVAPISSATTTSPASKASGSITVYNAFSTSPVKLIKNTRFQTPDGLIFRAPADISVPGEKGTTPGKVEVTVIADQEGDQYNVGPVARFTLPGLKTSAMYTKVYASSAAAMTGGSSGVSGPGVASGTLAAALSELQARLKAKALDTAASQAGSGNTILPELIQITYTTQPNTPEAGGSVRVHESAHVQAPVFSTSDLAQTVGSDVAADTTGQSLTLVPGTGFAATLSGAPVLGTDPISFTLSGQANIIWNVDTQALSQALAGHPQSAFQTIIGGFPSIQEAQAKVEPFWKNTFPTNPQDIKIVVTPPQAS
jgi:hypothetical protein